MMQPLKSFALGVFVLSGLLLASPAALAQQPDRPERPDLGLSDEQKEQVKQIHASQREQLEAIRQDTSLSREEKRAKAQEIRKNTRSQMEALLTPEQREKLRKHRQELRHRRGKRHGGRGPADEGPPDAGAAAE
jgi:Spy/CpxP family protein refolding chaperone